MKKNMLDKLRRTKRVRLTNSIRRILERKGLPETGEVVVVLTKYGRLLRAYFEKKTMRYFPTPRPGKLTPYSFSRHEIIRWAPSTDPAWRTKKAASL